MATAAMWAATGGGRISMQKNMKILPPSNCCQHRHVQPMNRSTHHACSRNTLPLGAACTRRVRGTERLDVPPAIRCQPAGCPLFTQAASTRMHSKSLPALTCRVTASTPCSLSASPPSDHLLLPPHLDVLHEALKVQPPRFLLVVAVGDLGHVGIGPNVVVVGPCGNCASAQAT